MHRKLKSPVLGATLLLIGSITAAGYAQDDAAEPEPTIEERVTRLERELTGLETRFEARTTEGPSEREGVPRGVTTRVTELERRLDRLARDLTRVERQAAAALREANQARRDARTAQQAARDAALRR